MAYKSIQLDDFLATRRRKAGNLTPGQQRMFGAVTDIGAFAKYLDRLIQEHAKLVAGSAFRDPRIRFDWKLINVAKTTTKSGVPFFYFDAVDRGRKAIHTREGKALVFTISSPEQLLRAGVRASKAENITTKALGEINTRFPQLAAEEFRRFLNEKIYQARDRKGRFKKGGKAVRLGNVSARGRVSRDIASPKAVALPTGVIRKQDIRSRLGEVKLIPEPQLPRILSASPEATADMINDAVAYADELLSRLQEAARAEQSSIGKASQAALAVFEAEVRKEITRVQNQFKTSREFATGSARALNNLFNAGDAAKRIASARDRRGFLQAAKQVELLLSKLSYTQVAAIFKPLAEDQISAFEDATPSRQNNGRFKLIYTGAGSKKKKKGASTNFGYEALPPDTGGELKASYVFMTGNQFQAFINRIAK